jgi:3-carboxy-cis,cis-muconate cycloisomerase
VRIDPQTLAEGIRQDGFPIIALVKQLQAKVGEDAAPYVHWGATTQDIMDTAFVLQAQKALAILQLRLKHLMRALAALARSHRETMMAGRTHSQQALPITFGLQVAAWLAPLLRHDERLEELKPRLLVVQFGGAVGTLAALGNHGIAVQDALAGELNLRVPLVPWHTQRDALAELAAWLSLVSASLGKMGQDILLLAQTEVGEVREAEDMTRGGSSTMPQKSNPISSEVLVALARANASLLASVHQTLIQELQRGTHGLQLEWLSLPQMFANTGAALRHANELGEHLVVNRARMLANVKASQGVMLAEALTFALSEHMPRAEAKKIVARASQDALTQGRHLADIVREETNAPLDWQALREEENYLGAAQELITRVLDESAARVGNN